MTDVVPEPTVDLDAVLGEGPLLAPGGLDVVDEHLIDQLADRARAGGLQLAGEGGLLQQLIRRLLESALEASSPIIWATTATTPPAEFWRWRRARRGAGVAGIALEQEHMWHGTGIGEPYLRCVEGDTRPRSWVNLWVKWVGSDMLPRVHIGRAAGPAGWSAAWLPDESPRGWRPLAMLSGDLVLAPDGGRPWSAIRLGNGFLP